MTDTHRPRDRDWLEDIFRRHSQAVLAYARRRVPMDEAEDIVAEVFTVTWQKRTQVPEATLPWLYRTASFLVLKHHRGAGRRERLAGKVATASGTSVADHADEVVSRLSDEGALVRTVLQQLSHADAEVLRLHAWEELDIEALALALGCTRPAARVKLHRARKRFERALARHPAEPLTPPTLLLNRKAAS